MHCYACAGLLLDIASIQTLATIQKLLQIHVKGPTWIMRWSPGRRSVSSVELMAAMPLAVTTLASAPSIVASFAASACRKYYHIVGTNEACAW